MPTKKTFLSYKYDELTPKAQNLAVNLFHTVNIELEWWNTTYEDAACIGLKLTSFDLDRNRHCKGEFEKSALNVAKLILDNHGKDCETYKTAQSFVNEFDANEPEDVQQAKADRFLLGLLENYADMLQNEFEYCVSDEAIIETIKANDYNFFESGLQETVEAVEPDTQLPPNWEVKRQNEYVYAVYDDLNVIRGIGKTEQLAIEAAIGDGLTAE